MSNVVPDVSDDAFTAVVLESDRPVLVDFWAPWCAPCRGIAPILEQLAGELGDRLDFVKVDTDQNPESARQAGVTGLPTLVLYVGGAPAATLRGPRSKRKLREELTALVD